PAHVIKYDSDVDRVINYRIPVNSDVLADGQMSDSTAPEHFVPPPGPFQPRWWEKHTSTVNWEKRNPFIPCAHEGSCVKANCRCFREGVTCEKTCKCPPSCNRRFPGCSCSFDNLEGSRVCGAKRGCLCVKFKRECDADLCGSCGATEILDPINRYNEELLHERCTNVGIQRGVPKKTLLGQSEVHGFGLYAGQDIRKDDMIGEYTGEIISNEESERRAVIYEYEKNMYLFKLNKKQEVDATYMGNKVRFINNANKNLTNCHPKVLLCNTVFRVALYASVDIEAGTEFFFHYNYPEEMTMHFKQPKGKVFAVKQ
ncbi:SET domain-containing protein, partial [Setomelanomma holmii]